MRQRSSRAPGAGDALAGAGCGGHRVALELELAQRFVVPSR
jgi:hypothetical protein